MNVLKRVKFRDPGTSKPPNFKPDISSIQNEATQSPRCANLPKTSEYAFFKKVKKNARGHSYPLQKNDNRLKDGELTECTKEILNKAKQSYEELTPSLPVKKSKPINHESFFSLTVVISKNQAVTNMVNPTSKAIRSPLFVKKVKPRSDYFSSSPFSGGSKKEGNQYSNKGVFSTRRQRLRCWVSTSLPELDESFSKGVDFVVVLLSRLFPEENENNFPHNESCLYNSDRAYEVFEGMLNPDDWRIINFQIPCDVEIGPVSCPLLLKLDTIRGRNILRW